MSGKAPGVDGITWELLKYGGEAVSDWIHVLCTLAYKEECLKTGQRQL